MKQHNRSLFIVAIVAAMVLLSGCLSPKGSNAISGAVSTLPAKADTATPRPESTPTARATEPEAAETDGAKSIDEVEEAETAVPTPTAKPTEEVLGEAADGGVWFKATQGGSNYDLFCTPEKCRQPRLPEMGDRVAHQVEFTLDEGTYWFFGVEAALFNADSGRAEIARRENGVLFLVPTDGTKYVADVLGSEAGGFSIYAEEAVKLDGTVFSSPQGHEYDVLVGGDSGDWYHQPWLPSVRIAHGVELLLPIGRYLFNGVECSFTEDGVTIGGGNQIPFDVVETPSTITVTCKGGDGSGFSIETVSAASTEE